MRVLTLAGSGTQRGLDHGREEAAAIRQTAVALKAELAASGRPPAALAHRLTTHPMTRTAADLMPDLWDEVAVMAHASRMDLDDLLLLVFASDLAAYAEPSRDRRPDAATFGGTAVARVVSGRPGDAGGGGLSGLAHEPVPPTTEIGQTVDLPPWARQRMGVLRIGAGDDPNALLLAHPGSLGLCGANQAGLAVATTALPGAPVSELGLGVSFIVRHLLTLDSLARAEAFLTSVPHAVGRAYVVVARDGIGCYEADADGVRQVDDPTEPTIAHADHRLAAKEQQSMKAEASSRARLAVATRLLDDGQPLDRVLASTAVRDGADDDAGAASTVGAFRARGADASARFIDGAALSAGRDWSRLTYA